MGRKKKLKRSEVTEALQRSHGLKTGACELLGVSFPTLERYIAEDTEAQEIVRFWRDRRTDRAEYKLDEAIERGEAWAVALALKNSRAGKERGYGDSVDVTSAGQSITAIRIIREGNGSTDQTS